MSSEQGWFESDEDYKQRTAQEANERTIETTTGEAPAQGFLESVDSYRERISAEANERKIEQATGSAPSQGFFESNESYLIRIERESNEQILGQLSGSTPSQEFFESDLDYETRVRRESNERIIEAAKGSAPRQGFLEGDHDYRSRIAHEARIAQVDVSDDQEKRRNQVRTPLSSSGKAWTPNRSAAAPGEGSSGFTFLIVAAAVVIGILWILFNIALPLVILNAALILTILAIVRSQHKFPLAVSSLMAGCYLLLDIANGWLSKSFVENIVHDERWISGFVIVNAFAMGVSAMVLTLLYWQNAAASSASLGLSDSQKLSRAVLVFVVSVAAAVVLPTFYFVGLLNSEADTPNLAPHLDDPQPPAAASIPAPQTSPRRDSKDTLAVEASPDSAALQILREAIGKETMPALTRPPAIAFLRDGDIWRVVEEGGESVRITTRGDIGSFTASFGGRLVFSAGDAIYYQDAWNQPATLVDSILGNRPLLDPEGRFAIVAKSIPEWRLPDREDMRLLGDKSLYEISRVSLPTGEARSLVARETLHWPQGTSQTATFNEREWWGSFPVILSSDGKRLFFQRNHTNFENGNCFPLVTWYLDLEVQGAVPVPLQNPDGGVGCVMVTASRGNALVFEYYGEARGIWVADLLTGRMALLRGGYVWADQLSPDGRKLMYTESIEGAGGTRLRIIDLPSGSDDVLETDPSSLRWSPDSSYLLGWSEGKIVTINLRTGQHREIAVGNSPQWIEWDATEDLVPSVVTESVDSSSPNLD